MKKWFTLTFFVTALLLISNCKKDTALKSDEPTLPANPYSYVNSKLTQVMNFGDNTNMGGFFPNGNSVTDEKATLGRVLFYDRKLSINNAIACASCHKQAFAFADQVDFNEGFGSEKALRNSMPISNLINKSSFFWDGRAKVMEDQALMPIRNHIEMGLEKIDVLPQKLARTSYYPNLFQSAFGSTEITNQKIAQALTAFMRSIVCVESKFDLGALNANEMHGMDLFFNKFQCVHCHTGNNLGGSALFSPYSPIDTSTNASLALNASNIGLDVKYPDGGIGDLLGNSALNGFFIIPSLRNVELTAPYMHDGRFKTLEEVVEHYNSGIVSHPTLDGFLLQNRFNQDPSLPATPVRMNMTPNEKADLVAFLKALTDRSILTDPKFSNPF